MIAPDLNAALAVYLGATVPKEEALDRWLEEYGTSQQRRSPRADVIRVVDEATRAVEHEPGGVRFTREFWQRLHQHLLVQHPWITRASVEGMQGYLGWYCWHEGLFAPDGP